MIERIQPMGLARWRKNLTHQALQKCINRGQRFVHIKPQHLHQERGALQSAGRFYDAAWLAGFRAVISTFRSNSLARAVSSYERMPTGYNNTETFAAPVLRAWHVHVYASRAVQFQIRGDQFDFVWLSARTPHGSGSYVW